MGRVHLPPRQMLGPCLDRLPPLCDSTCRPTRRSLQRHVARAADWSTLHLRSAHSRMKERPSAPSGRHTNFLIRCRRPGAPATHEPSSRAISPRRRDGRHSKSRRMPSAWRAARQVHHAVRRIPASTNHLRTSSRNLDGTWSECRNRGRPAGFGGHGRGTRSNRSMALRLDSRTNTCACDIADKKRFKPRGDAKTLSIALCRAPQRKPGRQAGETSHRRGATWPFEKLRMPPPRQSADSIYAQKKELI